MTDATHYALRLANGEALESILCEVANIAWGEGNIAAHMRGEASEANPYGERGY